MEQKAEQEIQRHDQVQLLLMVHSPTPDNTSTLDPDAFTFYSCHQIAERQAEQQRAIEQQYCDMQRAVEQRQTEILRHIERQPALPWRGNPGSTACSAYMMPTSYQNGLNGRLVEQRMEEGEIKAAETDRRVNSHAEHNIA